MLNNEVWSYFLLRIDNIKKWWVVQGSVLGFWIHNCFYMEFSSLSYCILHLLYYFLPLLTLCLSFPFLPYPLSPFSHPTSSLNPTLVPPLPPMKCMLLLLLWELFIYHTLGDTMQRGVWDPCWYLTPSDTHLIQYHL